MTGIVEANESMSLSVYPNPTANNATIQFFAKTGQEYKITLHSALGQQVAVIHQGQLNEGLNKLEYNTTDLAKGIYLVRIESEGRLQTVKLIKE